MPKKYNNYSISILCTACSGVVLGTLVLIAHALSLDNLIPWITDTIYGVSAGLLTSQIVSGNGYFYMLFDKLFKEDTFIELAEIPAKQFKKNSSATHSLGKTQSPTQDRQSFSEPTETFWQRLKKLITTDFQFNGLWLGVAAAIALSTVQIVFHTSIPFDNFGTYISHGILVLGNLSLFCGLGNRLGRVGDYIRKYKHQDPKTPAEKQDFFGRVDVHYTLSIIFGFMAGIGLTAAILFTMGLATFMTGGGLGLVILTATVVSSSASASGYIGRVFDVIFDPYTYKRNDAATSTSEDNANSPNPEKKSLLTATPQQQKSNPGNYLSPRSTRLKKIESILTIAGVTLGIGLALFLILTGTAALVFPFVGTLTFAFSVLLVTAFSISALGGLGIRLGHMIDKFRAELSDTALEQINMTMSGQQKIKSPTNYPNVQTTPANIGIHSQQVSRKSASFFPQADNSEDATPSPSPSPSPSSSSPDSDYRRSPS